MLWEACHDRKSAEEDWEEEEELVGLVEWERCRRSSRLENVRVVVVVVWCSSFLDAF